MRSLEYSPSSPTSGESSSLSATEPSRGSSDRVKYGWLAWVLTAPLVIACLLTAAGLPVVGVDDYNYSAVLGTLNLRDLVVEQASWILLNLPALVISDTTLALRAAGLLAALLSVWAMTRPSVGQYGLAMFCLSVLPLYFVLYFNQVRLLISFVIFAYVFSYARLRLAAGPAALMGHLTGVIMAFPPALILVSPMMQLASYLDPTNIVALKISAYLGAEYFSRPLYFGWELAVLAVLYMFSNRIFGSVMIMVTLVGIYMISDALGVIAARRLIELSLLAYSPLIMYLRERRLPGLSILGFYLALGLFQTTVTLAAGVVRI